MRILIDTNILISSILWSGTPYQAYIKAVSYPNKGIICTQNVDELRRIFNRKFPAKISLMERFLSLALESIELVQVPDSEVEQEISVRDIYDRPIMRAAVHAKADIILTGDKDFLESGINKPIVMSPIEFLNQADDLFYTSSNMEHLNDVINDIDTGKSKFFLGNVYLTHFGF